MHDIITAQEAAKGPGRAENIQDNPNIMKNTKSLYLEDDTFQEARQNFNIALQRLLKNMEESKSAEGSITLKLDILIESETIPNADPDIDAFERKARIPTFSHKVSSQVTVKDEIKWRNNPNMELIWNEELKCYELKYVADTTQKTIFDKDIMEQYNEAEIGAQKQSRHNEEYIEADYTVDDEEEADPDDYAYEDPEE